MQAERTVLVRGRSGRSWGCRLPVSEPERGDEVGGGLPQERQDPLTQASREILEVLQERIQRGSGRALG